MVEKSNIDGETAKETASWTTSDALFDILEILGFDYVFAVLGSDHPSLIEAYTKRERAGKQTPELLVFSEEFTAISAADAYARLTCKAQFVLVHVDVGTAALGQGVHNASNGRAPLVIFAGLAPITSYGELTGSRSEHVHWVQDVPRQESIMAPYWRYAAEIKSPAHVATMLKRALLFATTGSQGPSYLTATREVLAAPAERHSRDLVGFKQPSCNLGGLPGAAVKEIGDALLKASDPLVVTGYLGRTHRAVRNLVKLADLIPLKVFDSEYREVSFPFSHPAWVNRSTGSGPAIKQADVILILDSDVPWIPTKVQSKPDAVIYHIDLDPRKERMMIFNVNAQETYQADCGEALDQLCSYISSSSELKSRESAFSRRRSKMEEAVKTRLATLDDKAKPTSDGLISVPLLFKVMHDTLPRTSILLGEATTNSGLTPEQMRFDNPGTYLTKGGSGLGWGLGAAIGAKLASKRYDWTERPHLKSLPKNTTTTTTSTSTENKGRFTCVITGDGSFLFANAPAVYHSALRHDTPFLTVLLNNGGWKATRLCIKDVHPDGVAAAATNKDLGIGLRGQDPDYGGVAKAASRGRLWTRTVEKSEELEAVLREAVQQVESGTGAFVEVILPTEP